MSSSTVASMLPRLMVNAESSNQDVGFRGICGGFDVRLYFMERKSCINNTSGNIYTSINQFFGVVSLHEGATLVV